MTLSGYFALNSVFAPACLASDCAAFENKCVRTNKDRHIPSAAQRFGRDSTFWQYKVYADIRACLWKRGVKGQWDRALTLVYTPFLGFRKQLRKTKYR